MVGLLGFRNAVDQFSDHKLVCIDEFELDDPGETVLMSTFLNELVNRGVNVDVTSNTLPDRLGAERFAPTTFCVNTPNAALDNWQALMDHLSKVHPAQYGPMVANLSL